MPVHHHHAVRDQRVRGAHRGFRVEESSTAISCSFWPLTPPAALMSAMAVGAGLQLFAKGGVRTCERTGDADLDLGVGRCGGGKADGHEGGSGEKDITQGRPPD